MAQVPRCSSRRIWICGRKCNGRRTRARGACRWPRAARPRDARGARTPAPPLLLSGKLLTGRDAAHKRICALLDAGKPLPDGLDFHGRVIYYVGPVDPVGTEVVGPAGPTTAYRMDRFTDTMLGKSGLLAMVGKAE